MAIGRIIKFLKTRIHLKTRIVNASSVVRRLIINQKPRFLSIFGKKYEAIGNTLPKLNKKRVTRNLVIIGSGLVVILIIGSLVYRLPARALEPGLLEIIIAEMKSNALRREEWNRRITFRQKISGYASMASSALQPLIPPKRYRLLYRMNYAANILLNSYMLFIDFYRK